MIVSLVSGVVGHQIKIKNISSCGVRSGRASDKDKIKIFWSEWCAKWSDFGKRQHNYTGQLVCGVVSHVKRDCEIWKMVIDSLIGVWSGRASEIRQ